MVNLIKNYISNDTFSTQIKLLLDSILKYPQLTGGINKFDSELMKITKGKIFSKGGAEGVLLFAHKEKKIGGVIKIKDGNVYQSREVISGGRYLSGSDPLQVFAASDSFMLAEIQWRDGTITVIAVSYTHLTLPTSDLV